MNTYLYYVRIKTTYLSYAIIYEYTTWEEHTYVVIYIHWHKDTHSSYLLTNWDAPPHKWRYYATICHIDPNE